MTMHTFIATENDQGRTLYKFLIKSLKNPHLGTLESLFRKKDIKVNGKRTKDKKYTVREGDEIVVYGFAIAKEEKAEYERANISFTPVYEDENILIVSKKYGVKMHDDKDSLDNQVLTYLNFKPKDSFAPSHISRLDKVTSGLVVYGKTYYALRQLKEKISDFEKIYELKSSLPEATTTTFKISHDEKNQREVCGDYGKDTKTEFFFENDKLFAKLFTGKKHQIRASLSKLGYPILGDRKYGGKPARRVYLHSTYIRFFNLEGELQYLNNKEFRSLPKW